MALYKISWVCGSLFVNSNFKSIFCIVYNTDQSSRMPDWKGGERQHRSYVCENLPTYLAYTNGHGISSYVHTYIYTYILYVRTCTCYFFQQTLLVQICILICKHIMYMYFGYRLVSFLSLNRTTFFFSYYIWTFNILIACNSDINSSVSLFFLKIFFFLENVEQIYINTTSFQLCKPCNNFDSNHE